MSSHTTFRRTGVIGLAVAVALVTGACSGGSKTEKGLVIGKSTSTSTALPGPDIVEDPTTTTADNSTTTGARRTGGGGGSGPAVKASSVGIPDGSPYGDAIPFTSSTEVPTSLVWILAIGSDARPGGDMRKSNGDSIHLIGVDPQTGVGTVVGFPRDSWVKIPGHGTGKINSALAMGGPKLMAETVRQLTGLPVDYYVLTAFEGFQKIVDEVGGVHVQVDKKMNDKYSGARFDPGWHDMSGGEALAYSRDRHDVANGDFTRSLHQGNVMLSGLAKLRAEVGDDAGLQRWIGVLLRHADLDSPPQQLLPLAALARRLDPAKITNVVVPGRVGTAGAASVVYLTDDARKLFLDLRPDAAIGGPSGDEPRPAATTTTTIAPSTTTTSAPAGAETTTSTAPHILPTTTTTAKGLVNP
ncbi:MAG TPA: LCP family protein [Acidimicrobiia bacterium]|jgi:LCP family protein required for cell wall assembly|nr:LCP family protein [Acidimicrobiia bacterium]